MQKNIDILTDLINKSGLSLGQKKLAFDCISNIVSNINILDDKYQKRIKNNNKDFIDYYDRVKTLLLLLGVTDLDIMEMNFNYYDWIVKHANKLTSQLTVYAIKQMIFYLQTYDNCYDGNLPESLDELKKFILEPLEITEETFEAEYKKALIEFRKTKVPSEIMKIGWFKQLTGKIKTSYIHGKD